MRTVLSIQRRRNCPAPSDELHFGPFSVAKQLRLEVRPQAYHNAEWGSGKEKGQESTFKEAAKLSNDWGPPLPGEALVT